MPRGLGCRHLAPILGVVALFAASPPAAQAGWNSYCAGQYFASGADCFGPKHSLRKNRVHNVDGYHYSVAASALRENWSQYGSWVYGTQWVCHSYSGANILYPWMYNSDYRGQWMTGVEWWGSEPAC